MIKNDLMLDTEFDKYIGTTIKGYCIPNKLLYPNTEMNNLGSGEFGILSIDMKDLVEGKIDQSFNISWGPEPLYNITIKGNLPKLYRGKEYYVECNIEKDARYGLAFVIKEMHIVTQLTERDKQKMFVEYAVGPVKCELLYRFISDPYDSLLNRKIKTLTIVPGIANKTAETLIEKFYDKLSDAKNIIELKFKYELTDNMISKLKAKYHSTDTILQNLAENPYILMEVDGIGWKKADEMALKGGYDKKGRYRVRAYCMYYLETQAELNGHSWVYLSDLYKGIKKEISEVTKEEMIEYFKEWTGRILSKYGEFLYYDELQKRIGLIKYRNLEENICEEINRILEAPIRKYDEKVLSEIIMECENNNGFTFTEEQKKAIYNCFNSNFTIITGKAGTGKTSIMGPVTMFLKRNGMRFDQVALAGKAASNLSEVTGEEGKTIHRLLGYQPDNGFSYNKINQLDSDVIILDEFSLVGGSIFYNLIQAIKSGSKIIALGDTAQLESIGMANLLKDCIESGKIPFSCLTKIHRQAARSAIITESVKISCGEQIISNSPINEIRGELQDLKVITYQMTEESKKYVINEYRSLLKKGISSDDISVVVPMRSRGDISCFSLNNEIQSIVNPPAEGKKEWIVNKDNFKYSIRINDKIINTKNDYNTETESYEPSPIFNGNIGKVVDIVPKEYIVVDFIQQGRVVIPYDIVSNIELAYAVTAHKMQGSQSPYVIVGIDMGAYTLLSKEWVYTALTRAKKYCCLIGQISALRKCANISRVSVKQNWLKELLQEE